MIGLVRFSSSWDKQGSSGKKDPQLKKFPIRLVCRPICGRFSWLMIDVGWLWWLRVAPSLGRWSWVCKKVDWAGQQAALFHGLCLRFCLQVLGLTSFHDGIWYGSVSQMNPSFPTLLLIMVLITAAKSRQRQWWPNLPITLAGIFRDGDFRSSFVQRNWERLLGNYSQSKSDD